MDDKSVQPDVVSEGTPSPEAPEAPQPLTEERITQIIAEQTELAKREIQSVKDKARAEVEQARAEAQFAQQAYQGLDAGFRNIDPEAAERAKQEATLRYYQQREAQATQRQQAMQVIEAFEANLKQHITDLGIDPNDKRIDWGDRETQNLTQRQQKILASVGKIQKESVDAGRDKLKKEFDEWKLQAEKDLGIHSHDTSTSAGAGVDFSKLSPTELIKLGLKEGTKKRK